MITVYRKPNPDCTHCYGRGVIEIETIGQGTGEVFETRSVRCYCTDFHRGGDEKKELN